MGQLVTLLVCISQHLTGIMTDLQETALRATVQDGGTTTVNVQY